MSLLNEDLGVLLAVTLECLECRVAVKEKCSSKPWKWMVLVEVANDPDARKCRVAKRFSTGEMTLLLFVTGSKSGPIVAQKCYFTSDNPKMLTCTQNFSLSHRLSLYLRLLATMTTSSLHLPFKCAKYRYKQ